MASWEQVRPDEARVADHEAQVDSVSWHRSMRTRLTVLSCPCSALLLPGTGLLTHASARDLSLDPSRGEHASPGGT